jgi:hypothetical protein
MGIRHVVGGGVGSPAGDRSEDPLADAARLVIVGHASIARQVALNGSVGSAYGRYPDTPGFPSL